jgi:HAD superfamily hydrolase (TIGR01509 family)
MDIKLVIFDFDGTIADTRKTIVIAKQETMKVLGLDEADEETCASTIGFSAKIGFKKIYPELSEDMLDLCVVTYRKIFNEKKEIIPPVIFPDVTEVLEILKQNGIMRTIATSRNNASLNEFLIKMNIADYFPYVLGGDDTSLLKPNPEPVLKTLKELSYKPEQTLVIGDMPIDIEMGKSAGTYTCGVTYGNANKNQLACAGADFIIDKMSDLTDVLHLC